MKKPKKKAVKLAAGIVLSVTIVAAAIGLLWLREGLGNLLVQQAEHQE
ncbi:MAG TPA: hypothetical protein P5267_01280 [Patescibacteria group bacterium]|nr:hypothetical protein [Patescibacteria group bacterium]